MVLGQEGNGSGCLGVLFWFNAEIISLRRVLAGGSMNSATASMFISIMRYVHVALCAATRWLWVVVGRLEDLYLV